MGKEKSEAIPEVFEEIGTIARLSGSKIELRDIVDKWLLLTYDIPHTPEGDKARREFLTEAAYLGATQQTESVYLIPWTPQAEMAALKLARFGKTIVWTSSVTDKSMAREITRKYDQGLQPVMEEIGERLDRIAEHYRRRRFKRANKMVPKTDKMMDGLVMALLRRGSKTLFLYFEILKKRYAAVLAFSD